MDSGVLVLASYSHPRSHTHPPDPGCWREPANLSASLRQLSPPSTSGHSPQVTATPATPSPLWFGWPLGSPRGAPSPLLTTSFGPRQVHTHPQLSFQSVHRGSKLTSSLNLLPETSRSVLSWKVPRPCQLKVLNTQFPVLPHLVPPDSL